MAPVMSAGHSQECWRSVGQNEFTFKSDQK